MALRQSDLFDRVRAMGLTIRKNDGEYRVAYVYPDALPGGHGRIARIQAKIEDMAHYTDDRDDAYATAIHMSKECVRLPALQALRNAG